MAPTLVPSTVCTPNSFPVLLLLLQLGCFFFSSSPAPPLSSQQQQLSKRRKVSPFSPAVPTPHPANGKTTNSGSVSRSILSHLKCLLSFTHHRPRSDPRPAIAAAAPGRQWQSPDRNMLVAPEMTTYSPQCVLAKHHHHSSFTIRGDIYPCLSCGEVFGRVPLLHLHHAAKHALSELADSDSGKNIVRIIFQSGWKAPCDRLPSVRRILKVHNSTKTLARFEDHRKVVRTRAAARADSGRGRSSEEERCIADGNERLRFYCTTYVCGLGERTPAVKEGSGGGTTVVQGTCGSPYCSACGIVRHGFGGKTVMNADGVATQGTGWAAHASLPEDLEEEFAFVNVRRVMVVCRVVAGGVALGSGRGEIEAENGEMDEKDEEEGGGGGGRLYDSMVVNTGGVLGEEELVVFNPRAVLPCFLILYSL